MVHVPLLPVMPLVRISSSMIDYHTVSKTLSFNPEKHTEGLNDTPRCKGLNHCLLLLALSAQKAVNAARTTSYAVNVTAADGAAFKMLGRLPLYRPRTPSLLYICARQAGREFTDSGRTLAPYLTDLSKPATCMHTALFRRVNYREALTLWMAWFAGCIEDVHHLLACMSQGLHVRQAVLCEMCTA